MILAPVAALMVYASYYLWKDYQPKVEQTAEEEQSQEQIGTLINSEKNVKRKTQTSLMWDDLSKAQPLYNLDSIRTGVDSQALIQLNDKSVISLEENSLIVLEKNAGSLNVDFKTGDISTQGQNLKIKIKDSTIDSNAAELRLKTDTENRTQVVVKKGAATLTDKEKKQIQLTPEKLVKVDEKGKAEAVAVQVVLSSPQDSTTLLDPNAKITYPFTWAVLNEKLKQEFFELSQDRNFSQDKTFARNAHQGISAPLERGTSYWRVGWDYVDSNGKSTRKFSEVRTIKLTEDKRISLISPANETSFELEPGNDSISFSWSSELKAKAFVFEVSPHREFDTIIVTKTIADAKVTINQLKTGAYYWRVKAYGEKNQELGKSGYWQFYVKQVIPRAPTLTSPENGFLWSLADPLRFEWTKYPTADKYRMHITKDSEGRQVVTTRDLPETQTHWRWTQPGPYYWFVESLDKDQKILSRSLIYRFEIAPPVSGPFIKLLKPANLHEVKREKKEIIEPVSLEWQPEKPVTANYTVLISDKYDLENPVKKEKLTTTKINHTFEKTGNYYWKVLWTDPQDATKTENSSIGVIKFKLVTPLIAPELITPANKTETIIELKEPVEFTWKEVSGASHYRITIEKHFDDGKKTLVADEIVDTTKYTSQALDKGRYVWTVKSIDSENLESPASTSFEFAHKPNEVLSAPKIKPAIVK